MDKDVSVTLPIIKRAVFSMDFQFMDELFELVKEPFQRTIGSSDYFTGLIDDVLFEERVKEFKEEIIFYILTRMIYSDYGKCQDLSALFDDFESGVENELLIDGVDEIDTLDPEFQLPSFASPLLHFIYYFTNFLSHEKHKRITEILKDIHVVDDMGVEINWDEANIRLDTDQFRLLTTIDL